MRGASWEGVFRHCEEWHIKGRYIHARVGIGSLGLCVQFGMLT